MSNKGHLLKYKNENNEWVSIPFTASDMYDMYVEYCVKHGYTAVTDDVYYNTIGGLMELVNRLTGSSDALTSITKALSEGALPAPLGGTGITISRTPDIYTLLATKPDDWGQNDPLNTDYRKLVNGEYVPIEEWEEWQPDTYYIVKKASFIGESLDDYLLSESDSEGNPGLDLATKRYVVDQVNNIVKPLLDFKLDTSKITSGVEDGSTKSTVGVPEGTLYFQYK